MISIIMEIKYPMYIVLAMQIKIICNIYKNDLY